MSGKKLFNSAATCVSDSLEGFVAINTGLSILAGHQVVVRADIEKIKTDGKVTLVSGGGSGHEPAHAGYVGRGMLSAAVCGAVFTSPPPSSILSAIRVVGSTAGTLLIVKNYTGDVLNFGLAAERAKAEGLKVEMVVVAEDCALPSNNKVSGRRGLCGTVFMHKLAGAMAEQGRSLLEILSMCKAAAADMGTIGLSLSPCSLPGSGPSFQLKPDEMELGLGIHGEAGVSRLKLQSAHDAVATMLCHMTNKRSQTHMTFASGAPVALIVNNLGGTSVIEMNIVAREAINQLGERGVVVERAYCGILMSSLEMAGVSLTVLHLNDTRRQLLDARTTAPGWVTPLLVEGETTRITPGRMACPQDVEHSKVAGTTAEEVESHIVPYIKKAVSNACRVIIKSEKILNELDTQSGDGDCGTTLKRGADVILQALESIEGLPAICPHKFTIAIATLLEKTMGGTSGALYSIFFTAAGAPLATDVSARGWSNALGAGIDAIRKYGGAEPGDRSMVDPLLAAHDVISQQIATGTKPITALAAAVTAAESKAVETAKMAAKVGRASYVNTAMLTQPDPGAHAVGIWLKALCDGLQGV